LDKKEILAFITKNPVAFMATIDGDKPRVRAMGTYRADENGIIFSMQSPKDVYKQLVKNPETEICYWAEGTQIRVSGRMEEIKDTKIKEAIVEARPFYKPGVEEQGLDYAGVFILKKGNAYVVDQKATPGSPKTYVDL